MLLLASPVTAKPLLGVTGREVAVDVGVRSGVIHVKFGFQVRGPTKKLWRIVSDYKRYPKYVDGLKKVKVTRRGSWSIVSLRGALLTDYRLKVRAKAAFKDGAGRIRWTVEGEPPPNTGEIRVDADGKHSVFSLATAVQKSVELPDFIIELGLRVAIKVVADGVRAAIEKK